MARRDDLDRWQQLSAELAPENTPSCFLACCGTVGLGRLLVEGELAWLARLRKLSSDPRWRVREAVCMALQLFGKANMPALLAEMSCWAGGNPFEQRAAAAGLCEPILLVDPQHAAVVLDLLDQITAGIPGNTNRKDEAFRVLRKGLGYCWSVAVAALPASGKPFMERWVRSGDPDIRWIMKQNLQKNRLIKLDPLWVERCISQMEHAD